jgi:glycosyltransferase involved in cell wall biosynthesis
MTKGPVIVDVAGGPMGGAARYRDELYRYLSRTGRDDVRVIGARRYINPRWLVRRELTTAARGRRVALGNVSFLCPGSERWTLLGNALHFLTHSEESRLDPSIATINHRKAAVVRMAARRSDVLVVPCSVMAERVIRVLPGVRNRVVVRMHPVSAELTPSLPRDNSILCPTFFRPYRQMVERLSELVTAIEGHIDPSIRVRVTADASEMPASLAANPRIELVGQLDLRDLQPLWVRSRAIYFPPGLESFGYPLAEARVIGRPVIARDTSQNHEIAGSALCPFTLGDADSLRHATELALATDIEPEPQPFDPDSYFDWILGRSERRPRYDNKDNANHPVVPGPR